MTPSSPDTPVLSAQGLQRSFGAVVAAADVNIDIRRGERLCLIGSNGAGKTTFVNMITGYLKPTAGRILLQGEDITQRTPREITRRGVARSFQIPQLYLQLSVLDNMLAALHANQGSRHFLQAAHDGASIARGLDLLERFGLAAVFWASVLTSVLAMLASWKVWRHHHPASHEDRERHTA